MGCGLLASMALLLDKFTTLNLHILNIKLIKKVKIYLILTFKSVYLMDTKGGFYAKQKGECLK
ncbi:hypothetical protein LBC_00810 [Campylobacter sp. 19-13652]|nr:hypothetical protein LBC_00810 [Campylobacter sp. 19-13652]